MQWDHGSPGVSAGLFAAARVFGDASYLAAAMRAQDDAWRRGILTKGLMLCHGISGTRAEARHCVSTFEPDCTATSHRLTFPPLPPTQA